MIYYSVKNEYRRMSRKLKCFLISLVFGIFSFSCGYAVDIQEKLYLFKQKAAPGHAGSGFMMKRKLRSSPSATEGQA